MRRFTSAFFLACRLLPSLVMATGGSSGGVDMRNCESLTAMPLCSVLYENVTFPNPRGHSSQQEANEELNEWQILIDFGCSTYLRHFLCAYYAPFCATILPPDLQVRPCKELCTHVHNACEPIMNAHEASWPDHLNCQLFPEKMADPLCFGPQDPSQLADDLPFVSATYQPLPNLSAVPLLTTATTTTSIPPSSQVGSATAPNFTTSAEKTHSNTPGTTTAVQPSATAVKPSIQQKANSSTASNVATICEMLFINVSADIIPTSTITATIELSSDASALLLANSSSQIIASPTGTDLNSTTAAEYDGSIISDSLSLNLPLYTSHTTTSLLHNSVSTHHEAVSVSSPNTASKFFKNITSSIGACTSLSKLHTKAAAALTTATASLYHDETFIIDATTTGANGYTTLYDSSPSSVHTSPFSGSSVPESLTSLQHAILIETSSLPTIAATSTTNSKHTFSKSFENTTPFSSTIVSSELPSSAASATHSNSTLHTMFEGMTTSTSVLSATPSNAMVAMATSILVLSTMGTMPNTTPQPMQDDNTPQSSCEPLSNPGPCQGLGYDNFSLPNLRGHATKENAEFELDQFSLLIRMNCSMKLRGFLCLYYLPKCSPDPPYKLFPCQEFCQEVQDECSSMFAAYKLVWPTHMNCQKLPSVSTSLCSLPKNTKNTSPLNQIAATTDGCKPRVAITPSIFPLCMFVITLVWNLLQDW